MPLAFRQEGFLVYNGSTVVQWVFKQNSVINCYDNKFDLWLVIFVKECNFHSKLLVR